LARFPDVIVSTHYLGEARNCDRVLFLRDGHVLAFDTPKAFLDRTGTDDLEAAFLELLKNDGSEDSAPGINQDEGMLA
jgi:ABC-2 type transport system ATP-binding protein